MSKKSFWIHFSVFLGCFSVFIVAYLLTPDPSGVGTHQQLFLPPCLFYLITKIPCPSCGLTTSFAHLAKGHLLKSFQTHPMGPAVFALILGIGLHSLFSLFKKQNSQWIWIAILFILMGLVLTWIVRLFILSNFTY